MTVATSLELFDVDLSTPADRRNAVTAAQREFGQYPTPGWAAAALVRTFLPDLAGGDTVLEPTCGAGRFLQAIPPDVPAVGVEIDPVLAEQARVNTGRRIVCGDFLTAPLDGVDPTVVVGNPPFETALIERILDRCHQLLPEDGRVMFILPAFFFKTAGRVVQYSERWALAQDLLPTALYPRLRHPIVFARFRKDPQRTMVGFSLYHEMAWLAAQPPMIRKAMWEGPATWASVVGEALTALGGEAALSELYTYLADRRPTPNQHWQAKVRQTCQRIGRRVGPGSGHSGEHGSRGVPGRVVSSLVLQHQSFSLVASREAAVSRMSCRAPARPARPGCPPVRKPTVRCRFGSAAAWPRAPTRPGCIPTPTLRTLGWHGGGSR